MSELAMKDPGIAWLDRAASEAVTETAKQMRLRAVNVADLISMQLPPRTMLLDPWMPSSGLVMVYAPRGLGKTWFAMGAAYAVASGGEFLGWQAPDPHPVLYLDGEMPGPALQERFASVIHSAPYQASPENLQILTPDLQERGMPDISTQEGQLALEPFTDAAKLIVVDNIATLCRSGKENEGESWLGVQEWALKMRAQGKTVLFVHHSGKGGQQRGTSRREDVLDTVIALRYPKGDEDSQGAKFELHFEKNRGFYGDDAKSREIELVNAPDGRINWQYQSLQDSTYQRVVTLLNEGLTQSEIARELDINKSNVSRHARRAEREGLYSKPKPAKKEAKA